MGTRPPTSSSPTRRASSSSSRSARRCRPATSGPGAGSARGFVPLFNGRDLTGWYTFLQKHGKNSDPDRVVTIEDGAIHLYKHAPEGSDGGDGLHRHREGIRRLPPPLPVPLGGQEVPSPAALKRDAGFYYHILGSDAVWPRRLQFQVQQTDVGDLIALYGFQLDTRPTPGPSATRSRRSGPPTSGGGRGNGGQGDRLPGACPARSRSTAGTRPR